MAVPKKKRSVAKRVKIFNIKNNLSAICFWCDQKKKLMLCKSCLFFLREETILHPQRVLREQEFLELHGLVGYWRQQQEAMKKSADEQKAMKMKKRAMKKSTDKDYKN